MVTNRKIRVGMVGANPSRGFASIAHIPALQALADFEISAVCTTRQDSADAAARHYGVPLAFCVSVKVPDHYLPVPTPRSGSIVISVVVPVQPSPCHTTRSPR